jgi:hypothetical protein
MLDCSLVLRLGNEEFDLITPMNCHDFDRRGRYKYE